MNIKGSLDQISNMSAAIAVMLFVFLITSLLYFDLKDHLDGYHKRINIIASSNEATQINQSEIKASLDKFSQDLASTNKHILIVSSKLDSEIIPLVADNYSDLNNDYSFDGIGFICVNCHGQGLAIYLKEVIDER